MPHALQITRFGGPQVLKWVETPKGSLSPEGVRIHVTAAGVNFADIMMRMGLYPEAPKPPFVPGYEIAGEVIEVGTLVKSVSLGDRVLAGTRFGGYTDEIVLSESQVRKIPNRLTDTEAAAIPVNFLTAWFALQEMARVRKGDRVLVQSAAGGVGIAAVQIAAQVGATVVGLVSNLSKADTVKSLGAKEMITYNDWNQLKDSEAGGFDVILDSQGGAMLKRCFRRLAPSGRVITFGASNVVSGETRSIPKLISLVYNTPFFTSFKLMMENKGLFCLNMLQLFNAGGSLADHQNDPLNRALDQIMLRFQDGSYRVVVGKTFPFQEGGSAHTELQSRANIGKIILTGPSS